MKKPRIIVEKPLSYMESWKQDTKRHRFWEGYPEFQKTDQPNMEVIMAETKTVMEVWFKHGVTYDSELERALSPYYSFGIPHYQNEPEELQGLLEIAYGKITASVLEWKKIPEYLIPPILMWNSATAEDKADFEWELRSPSPSFGPVFRTEGKPPKERAEIVGNDWYNLQSHRLYGFISEIYTTESDQWTKPKSISTVEKYIEAEQRLKYLGLSSSDRIEYYAHWLGFQNMEVANMLRRIGVNKSVEAVKKSYQRNRDQLRINRKKT